MSLPQLQQKASVLDKTFRTTGLSSVPPEVTEEGSLAEIRIVLSRTEALCFNHGEKHFFKQTGREREREIDMEMSERGKAGQRK